MSLIQADARQIPLRDGCVQCVVTSPPYFGLRDYGTTNQIGLEATPDAYVQQMVAVFREVRRVLADDGVAWLNLGDSYAGSANAGGDTTRTCHSKPNARDRNLPANRGEGIKPKDLIGIPWRVAFALQADGWYLRSDIIWHKPNPMPESVTDRPTKAHEYLFMLTKSERYFYDADAIAEASSEVGTVNSFGNKNATARVVSELTGNMRRGVKYETKPTRNRRSVWTVPTMPYSGAHFATMPEKLVEPCILAGSRLGGKRCDCDVVIDTPLGSGDVDDPSLQTGRAGFNRPRRHDEGRRPITRREQRDYAAQLKASPFRVQMEAVAGQAFAHYVRTDASGARPVPPDLLADWLGRGWLKEPAPCVHPVMPADRVFDPFMGSGTVGAVAERLGRRWVGTDLNPAYHQLARKRTAQRGLRFMEAV